MKKTTIRELKEEIKDLVKTKLPIAVDFDGTMVRHRFPDIGEENEKCVEVLKKWIDNGVGIILDTMRCGKELEEAIKWCKDRDIKLYGISKEPNQEEWTTSPKCYAVFSIDDRNLGVPLIYEEGDRPRVDWDKIDKQYSDFIIHLANKYKS